MKNQYIGGERDLKTASLNVFDNAISGGNDWLYKIRLSVNS